MRRRDPARRHACEGSVARARGQVDRPPMADPGRDGPRPRAGWSAFRASLDVRSTAACLARLTVKARPALDVLARNAARCVEGGGSTWNARVERGGSHRTLEVEGEGRDGLVEPLGQTRLRELGDLDAATRRCARRGAVRVGPRPATPASSIRPMERVAAPLRTMGADGRDDRRPCAGRGRRGGRSHGIGIAARGAERPGEGRGPARGASRADGDDRGRRAGADPGPHGAGARGAWAPPIRSTDGEVSRCSRFQHEGFARHGAGRPFVGRVPDRRGRADRVRARPSRASAQPEPAAFPRGDGDGWASRRGTRSRRRSSASRSGRSRSSPRRRGCGAGSSRDELPLVIDEVPVLAGARGPTPERRRWFRGGGGAPGEGERPARWRSSTASATLGGPGRRRGRRPRDRGRRARGRPAARAATIGSPWRSRSRRSLRDRPSEVDGHGGRGGQLPGVRGDARRARGGIEAPMTAARSWSRSTVRPGAASRRSPAGSRGRSASPTSTPG